jgi:hypothetical protein
MSVMSSYPNGWPEVPGVNAMNVTHLTITTKVQCVCVHELCVIIQWLAGSAWNDC